MRKSLKFYLLTKGHGEANIELRKKEKIWTINGNKNRIN